MKETKMKSTKSLSLILCIVLIAAMTLFTTGCSDNAQGNGKTEVQNVEKPQNNTPEDSIKVLGEGETIFMFTVTDDDGNDKKYEIHTDKTIVGDALLELGLIAGEEGDYGLYVKTVDGVTVDYDKDGKYWAFYIDGEYAMTGVDVTDITAGSAYSFKVE